MFFSIGETADVDDLTDVPRNFFGDVPEAFYANLGKVTMLAALLDQRLQDLYVQMLRVDQTNRAGGYSSEVIKASRQRLGVFPADQRDRVAGFFDAAVGALGRRNAVLHSLWRFSDGTEGGWRYPRGKAAAVGQIELVETSEVPRLIADLVVLNHEWMNIFAMVGNVE